MFISNFIQTKKFIVFSKRSRYWQPLTVNYFLNVDWSTTDRVFLGHGRGVGGREEGGKGREDEGGEDLTSAIVTRNSSTSYIVIPSFVPSIAVKQCSLFNVKSIRSKGISYNYYFDLILKKKCSLSSFFFIYYHLMIRKFSHVVPHICQLVFI